MPERLARALTSLFLLGVVIAGCAAAPRQTPPSGTILTYRTARPTGGTAVLCDAAAAMNPVRGILEGDPARSSQVAWLRGPDGRQITVAWPEEFSVGFEPDIVLYNERAQPVARHGQSVELGQVNVEDHAGTLTDPYLAVGIVFDRCYQPAR
jgi:hypothetical protein